MLLKTRHTRTIFRLAMALLALFGVLGIVHLPATFSQDMVDGMRGALLGATIAFLYLAFRLDRKRKNDVA
jgi:membrane-anchored glycerophosphoryl diester phosphodiesterase (GDPDase)